MSILKENGIEPEIRNYMKDPPGIEELREIAQKLGLNPSEFIRKKEKIFGELNVGRMMNDNEALFRVMSENPKLIERPIIIHDEKAIIGRPPQRVKELLQ